MGRMGGGGITKLSELTIDIAKDWNTKKIENLGAPDSADDAKRNDTTPVAHALDTHTGTLPDAEVDMHVAGEVLGVLTPALHNIQETEISATLQPYAFIVFDPSDFASDDASTVTKGVLQVIWRPLTEPTPFDLHTDLYVEGVGALAGSQVDHVNAVLNTWYIDESATPFTLPANLKTLQCRLWTESAYGVHVSSWKLKLVRV